METQLMFLDCPAYLNRDGSPRCGLPAEVRSRFTMTSTDGPLESAMIGCPAGHWFTGPLESLTLTPGPSRAGTGIAPGAGLRGAPLPGHRPVRPAGQVIVWLPAIGLAAAVTCALLLLVAALADGLGPRLPGPPPHPVPVPAPAPAPPGN